MHVRGTRWGSGIVVAETKQGPTGVVLSGNTHRVKSDQSEPPDTRTKALGEAPLRRRSLVKSEGDLGEKYESMWTGAGGGGCAKHIVGGSIAEHVVQCVCFGDVLGWFADDDDEFNFVVWEVILDGLGGLGNSNVR